MWHTSRVNLLVLSKKASCDAPVYLKLYAQSLHPSMATRLYFSYSSNSDMVGSGYEIYKCTNQS